MTPRLSSEKYWGSWYEVRRQALKEGLPVFLFAPEIRRLLNASDTWERHMLLTVLWKTGMKINEAMALTVSQCEFRGTSQIHFHIEHEIPESQISKRKGLMSRTVEVHDDAFSGDFKRYVRSMRLKPHSPVWTMTRQTAHRWLTETVEISNGALSPLLKPITLDTLRHSAAIHFLINGLSLESLQYILGYQKIESTAVYERIINLSQQSAMERLPHD